MTSFKYWLFAAMLLLAAPSFAVERAAVVLFSQGNVNASSENSSRPLSKGDDVVAGDTIHTGSNGRIQMRFTDGGLVSLTPNSSFAVEEYTQPSANSEGSLSFGLIKGGLRTLSGSIGKTNPSNYQMKTPVATLGIRGTQFIVQIDGEITRVHVGEGGVYLFNEFGELDLNAGDSAEVEPGKAPKFSQISPQITAAGTSGDGADDDEGDDDNPASDINLAQNLPLDGVLGDDDTAKMAAYRQLIYSGSAGLPPYTWSTVSGSGTMGSVPSISSPDFFSGGQVAVVGTDWDTEIRDGLVTIGAAASASGDSFNPSESWGLLLYAYGPSTTNVPMDGTLAYTLSQSTPVYVTGTSMPYNDNTLDKFNLNLVLSANGMSADVDMAIGNQGGSSFLTYEGGSLISSISNGTLNFAGFTPNSGSYCDSLGCSLDVNAQLIGNGASQIGLTYTLHDGNTNDYSGAASLTGGLVPDASPDPDVINPDGYAVTTAGLRVGNGDQAFDSPTSFLSNDAGAVEAIEDASGQQKVDGVALWWGSSFSSDLSTPDDFAYQAYVFGEESVDINSDTPLTGQLSYSLMPGEATAVHYYNSDGDISSYTLQKFDLDIDLDPGSNNPLTVAMQITDADPNDVMVDFAGAGDFGGTFGDEAKFNLWANSSDGDYLSAAGILSGASGEHAGVTYHLEVNDGTENYTGAAVLKKDGVNLGN